MLKPCAVEGCGEGKRKKRPPSGDLSLLANCCGVDGHGHTQCPPNGDTALSLKDKLGGVDGCGEQMRTKDELNGHTGLLVKLGDAEESGRATSLTACPYEAAGIPPLPHPPAALSGGTTKRWHPSETAGDKATG